MPEQIQLNPSAQIQGTSEDGTHEVKPDVAYQRLFMVNVVYYGRPHSPEGWVLIDAGLKGTASSIRKTAAERFGPDSKPQAIILTHGHVDHVGALKDLAEAWDVPIYAHEMELPYLNGLSSYPPPDPTVGGGLMAAMSGFLPRGPVDVSRWLKVLPPNGSVPHMPGWRWVHTPGHTPGHISLWRASDKVLIAGDAFITTRQESAYAVVTQRPEMHGPPMYYTQDWSAAQSSVRTLDGLAPEFVVTGHGRAMQGAEMRKALHELSEYFERIAVPRKGRYVDEPVRADRTGTTYVPPKKAKFKPKKLKDQVIVITGASSGIGLVTARMAAREGAKLVLAARSEEALRGLAEEILAAGGNSTFVVADVGREEDVQRIADKAIEAFGGFDTWVNNAGVSIYGNVLDVPAADMRRLFDTNYWGVVYGSLVAARHLRDRGGAIINLGSTLSDRAIPLQGTYCASKHAVKGFTDSLRMELETENAPVSVTLIKPAAIDTPYTHHAKNFMGVEPKNPAPVYAPEVVAEAILHCAVHPQRDVFAGFGGKAMSAQGYYAARLTDKYMEKVVVRQQQTNEPSDERQHRGLYEPSGELKERGGYPGHVFERSLYTKARLHPKITAALTIGLGVAVTMLLRGEPANGSQARKRQLRLRAQRLRENGASCRI
ncbi:MAG TPA: SDR family oxidoreductase [Candidatus Saccharimonadales bacterium]|nr:SDR family oxidoreductase [Candidatus Saccharimonadales bacterium]